ncbi:hypothetical protein [Flavisphingomonas formosensis]|uniref:hypothetical protein n=1 Tax=Flavisphingomonas formosensis TaxID=861534 RepID=UPI001E350038|nr:hypothetical protein [Sphingomonas formosensis]
MTSYFIDESGHGGDLASAKDLDFASQPIFVLAAVGTDERVALAAELETVRTMCGCGPGDIKSSMARLPQAVLHLTQFLGDRGEPIFIEIVDKRFFIAIHIVNHLLCGGMSLEAVDMPSRNAIAEFLADEPADGLLMDCVRACQSPDIQAMRQGRPCRSRHCPTTRQRYRSSTSGSAGLPWRRPRSEVHTRPHRRTA